MSRPCTCIPRVSAGSGSPHGDPTCTWYSRVPCRRHKFVRGACTKCHYRQADIAVEDLKVIEQQPASRPHIREEVERLVKASAEGFAKLRAELEQARREDRERVDQGLGEAVKAIRAIGDAGAKLGALCTTIQASVATLGDVLERLELKLQCRHDARPRTVRTTMAGVRGAGDLGVTS